MSRIGGRSLPRVALWRVDTGDRSHPKQFRIATRRALSSWEPSVAERLARRATLDAGAEIEASYVLGEALSEQNRAREAFAVLDTARTLPGPDVVRAGAAAGAAGVLSHQLGDLDGAEAVLQQTLEQISDPDARAILEGARATMRVSLGVPTDRGRDHHRRRADHRARDRARAHGDGAPRPRRPSGERLPRHGVAMGHGVPDDRPVPSRSRERGRCS